MNPFASVIFLLFAIFPSAYSQDTCKIMFYNTENLFDTVNDSLYNDEEFLPQGVRRWTNDRYQKKLDAISKSIIAAGGWQFPDVVGLCEVENKKVVASLAHREMLEKAGYSFTHFDSPDPRGIDLCMLYRPEKVKIIQAESWMPFAKHDTAIKTRDILFVKASVKSYIFDFILCHLPSKREGELVSAEKRRVIADYLSFKIDSINKRSEGREKIILMGDFNTSPVDKIIKGISESGKLVNLAEPHSVKGEGSYRFRGRWEMLDQIAISESLFSDQEKKNMDCYKAFNVLKFDFLLQDDPDYPGKRPFSTYREYKWQGGYSDHLPVLLKICL